MATVRITPETRAIIQELARESDQSMQEIIANAVEQYRRQSMLRRTNEAYAALRESSRQWSKEQEERRVWDGTLADGLESEE